MFGPLLPLKMQQRECFFPVYLKGAPQAVFVSRSEINLARKEYTLVEQLKGAPRPPPRAVFVFKGSKGLALCDYSLPERLKRELLVLQVC